MSATSNGTKRKRCIKSGADEMLEDERDEEEDDDEDILIDKICRSILTKLRGKSRPCSLDGQFCAVDESFTI